MNETTLNDPQLAEEISTLILWTESVGKVFKLITKSYGIRNVTYTQIKAVKEAETPGQFDIEVSCAEFTARVLDGKRAHSSGCKEGVIHQDEESILTPSSFGEECQLEEFDTVSAAILVHATMNLDLVMQHDPGEKTAIEAPLDLPHLKVTEMEASLLRNSPFLLRDVYLLSANSLRAAFESINQELMRASRNSRLTDSSDPIYVTQKDDAVTSLRNKLTAALQEITKGQTSAIRPAEACPRAAPIQKKEMPASLLHEVIGNESVPEEPKPAVSTGRRLGLTLLEKKNNIALALQGKASAASLSWEIQNPSKQGAVFRIGKECGLLEFVRWAHVSGRTVSEQESAGKKISAYFKGPDASYHGPDQAGVYPLLKIAA